MSRFLAPILVALFLACPQIVQSKDGWKTVQTDDKDFSLSMPANVKTVDRNLQGIIIKAFSAKEDGTNYSMTHGTGMKASAHAVDAINDGAMAEFKKQADETKFNLTVDKTKEEKGNGWSGKKSYLSVGSGKVEMLSAVSENGNVGYCLVAASKEGAHADPEFFSSFKVDSKKTNELYAGIDESSLPFKIGELLGFAMLLGLGLVVVAVPVGLFFLVRHLSKSK